MINKKWYPSQSPALPVQIMYTYYRNPTKWEISFGEGAIHYKDFPMEMCVRPNGILKQWLKCPVDGLRYYRSKY